MIAQQSKYLRTLLLVLLVSALVASCSSSEDETVKSNEENIPRVVNTEEAQLLSRVLYENHLNKNASFVARSGEIGVEGFVAQGKVDWDATTVELDVSLSDPSIVDLSSLSNPDFVYETYLGLDPSIGWVRRTFDATQYGIDALSLFIVKLASNAADNPLLVRQDGAQFLGVETVAGVDTKMLKSPGGITFYVAENGELKKVKAPIKGFANEVSIVLSGFSQTEIDLTPREPNVDFEDVSAFYLSNRPNF